MITNSTRFTRDPNVVTRKIAGETLIVPIRQQVGDLEALFTLNEVGTWIWNRLDGRTSIEQLAEELSGEFQVSPEHAGRDARIYLSMLAEAGLIRAEVDDAGKGGRA